MSNLSITPFRKALETLASGYKGNPNDLERDGLIQRFEYTLELCWKTSQKVLTESGIEVDTPKSIFRELAKLGWINDPELWFKYIKARNKANHIYHQIVADDVFSIIPGFIVSAQELLKILESKNK